MTTTLLDSPRAGAQAADPYHDHYDAPRGLAAWALTRDHKRLALLYLGGLLVALAAGAFLALLMRADLATPRSELGAPLIDRLLTSHGVLMVFVFAIPAIPATLGNFFLPLMIGGRAMAFPRLGLAAFWLWATGTGLVIAALTVGALDTGWTLTMPYALTVGDGTPVVIATVGVLLVAVSTLLTGLTFVVSVHKLRAPGVTWRRLPLTVVALYAGALVQIVATPILFVTAALLVLERTVGVGIFDPAMGGDPVLFQHFFWASVHPLVMAVILPAFGVVAEVVSVHARRGVARRPFVVAVVALALASVVQWGEHMFVSGESELATAFFSLTSLLGAAPVALLLGLLVFALRGGSLRLGAPLLFALGFVAAVTLGGLAGLPLAAASTNVHLHDTGFVVGHLHAVLGGGLLLALLAGLFHWFPKMSGRRFDDRAARLGAVLAVLGVVVMALSELALGARGLPREAATYLPEHQGLQIVAGLGGLALVAGLGWSIAVLVRGLRAGEPADANPWGGASLEWATTSPPPTRNFEATPHVERDPYAFDEPLPTFVFGGAGGDVRERSDVAGG